MFLTQKRSTKRRPKYRIGTCPGNWKLSQLEQRLMLAADAGVAVEMASPSLVASTTVNDATCSSTSGAVVFIDARVDDWNLLAADIDESATLVLIDQGQDAIRVISSTLATLQHPADSVHLVCHGQSGQLQLGRETINADSLNQSAGSLQQWSNHLRAGADVLVYGCDVAAGQQGHVFIQTLASLTGLDVAASTNVTGSTDGSDWILEHTVGTIESTLAFNAAARSRYSGTLNIVINAWGQTGEEQFNLRIDNQIVATYDAATTWTPFAYETNQSLTGDQIRIEFINDAYDPANSLDRNLFVNNIQVNGQNYETDDAATFSTGTWRPEDGVVDGFGRGRVLHTNGYFQYGADDTPPTEGSTIIVNTSGDEGDEQFVLIAGSRRFDPVTATNGIQGYEFQLDHLITADSVRVEFVNDLYDAATGIDRNLTVDSIVIDGVIYETESPKVYAFGVWDPVAERLTSGYLQTETLQGTGYFQYNNGSSTEPGFTLDTTLAEGGIRTLGSGSPRADAFRAPDGTIAVVNGEFRLQNDGTTKLINDLEMTLPNGQPDTSYGPGGLVEITPMIDSFSNSPQFRFTSIDDVAIDTQGRVVVMGKTTFGSGILATRETFIMRVTADGQLDTSFSANGYATTQIAFPLELAIDGSDRAIILGQTGWTRLDANGNLDLSFGSGGVVSNQSVGGDVASEDFAELIALADGSTLTLSFDAYADDGSTASIVKLDANGSLNTSFGNQGIAEVPTAPSDSQYRTNAFTHIVQDNQGRIVIGGELALRRFTANGQLDTSFGGGLVTLPSSVIDLGIERQVDVDSLTIDSQGRVLFASFFSSTIGRINADGSPDTSLSNDGFQSLTNEFNTKFRSIFIDAADRLVTVGDNLNNGQISYYQFG